MLNVSGEDSLSNVTIRIWISEFNHEKTSLEDDPCSFALKLQRPKKSLKKSTKCVADFLSRAKSFELPEDSFEILKINVLMELDIRCLQAQDEDMKNLPNLIENNGIYGIQQGNQFKPYLPIIELERMCLQVHEHRHFSLEKT
ncbi:Hypothetical protein SRAE_0000067000 [Strongyloides ratti]|uniref:Uncharacterized protein n=1 Tax=Strongyloides ratti TaxID=34506 RepID=A0A090L239_STRRB|nr:Hypothetical protein SRAE_0000067000 [Strongyloides ratti]CEF61549.1 Hypothetical protein SRAE_0000067000 [Strongyloides ratti]